MVKSKWQARKVLSCGSVYGVIKVGGKVFEPTRPYGFIRVGDQVEVRGFCDRAIEPKHERILVRKVLGILERGGEETWEC